MTLTIQIEDRYKPLLDELAKAIGATIETEETDSKAIFLNRLERSYQQAKQHERGEISLPTMGEFLTSL